MGLFRRAHVDPAEFQRLQEDIEALRRHVHAGDRQRGELAHRIDSIDHANMTLAQQVGPVSELADDVSTLDKQIRSLDERVTAVSTELANQLSELSNDIDALDHAASTSGDEPDDESGGDSVDQAAIEQLAESQRRLANEQARYQIAFREDLARLAEQLHRRHR